MLVIVVRLEAVWTFSCFSYIVIVVYFVLIDLLKVEVYLVVLCSCNEKIGHGFIAYRAARSFRTCDGAKYGLRG